MGDTNYRLQFTSGDSYLHQLYPLVKLAWVLIVAAGLFLFRTPASGAVLFVLVILVAVFGGKISLKRILSSSKLILGLGLILMMFHFFADPGNTVFRLGPLKITDNGLIQGPIFFFRLSVVVLASFLLIWTTDPRDLMVSLAKAGVPYRFAFAVFLALRFLPMIQQEVEAVQAAHSIRGRAVKSGLSHKIKLWQRYIFTVLVNGLRKAEASAAALDCRAFGCYPTRTYVKDVYFKSKDLIFPLMFIVIVTGLMMADRTQGWVMLFH